MLERLNTKYMCLFRKSVCPFRYVKTKMYLPKSLFFKNSLAGGKYLWRCLVTQPIIADHLSNPMPTAYCKVRNINLEVMKQGVVSIVGHEW